jgi:hypothetical protein
LLLALGIGVLVVEIRKRYASSTYEVPLGESAPIISLSFRKTNTNPVRTAARFSNLGTLLQEAETRKAHANFANRQAAGATQDMVRLIQEFTAMKRERNARFAMATKEQRDAAERIAEHELQREFEAAGKPYAPNPAKNLDALEARTAAILQKQGLAGKVAIIEHERKRSSRRSR